MMPKMMTRDDENEDEHGDADGDDDDDDDDDDVIEFQNVHRISSSPCW